MRIFLSLFATIIATLLVACDVIIDTPTPDNGDEKNLLITESIINMGAEGGEAEIAYSISQPVEGLTVEATTSSEWISDITVAEKISFFVDANTSSEQRVGLINISYGADKYTIGVQQAGTEDNNESSLVKITISQRKISVAAKGGVSSVGYSIRGVEEGVMPEAAVNVDWISNVTVDVDKVSFEVAKNSSTEKREATLTLSYDTVSSTATITQEGAVNEVVLTASATTIHEGDSVTFSVEYAGEDVTAEAKIYEYYTHAEVSNPMTFNAIGEYAYYAKYNNTSSRVLSIIVYPASAPSFPVDGDADNYTFKHRMLLIDHTGTDCGYCPYMMASLKEIEEDPAYNDYFNLAVAHSYNTSDAAYSSTALTMRYYYQKTLYVLTGFPTLTFNYQYGDSAGSTISYIKQHFNKLKKESTDAGVAVAAKLDGNKVVISASLKSKVARHYKVNILLLEDNIYSYQYNASQNWMHYHNNAIRSCYANITYSDITGDEWGYVGAMTTSNKVFELPIDNSNWVKSNCKVLVIIAAQDANYDNKYEVVNTTMCELGESKPFEYR